MNTLTLLTLIAGVWGSLLMIAAMISAVARRSQKTHARVVTEKGQLTIDGYHPKDAAAIVDMAREKGLI